MARTDKPDASRTTTVLLWIAGLALILGVFLAVRHLTHDDLAVRVAPATYQTLSSTVPTNGKVEPLGEFQAHAPTAGVIQKIYVQVGEHVKSGTLLLEMDSSDARKQLTAAQANVASAQASLADLTQGGSTEERNRFSTDIASARADVQQAENNLAVVKALQSKGAASAGEVSAAQTKLDIANMTLHNAQGRTSGRYSGVDRASAAARLADAQAGVTAARSNFAAVSIRSPRAGTVYSIPVAEYDFVPAGDDLLDVADLNQIQVRAYFDEPDIGKLARGQAVKIVWEAKPGMVWHGHILQPPTTVIAYQSTRSVGECIISVDDAKGDLLPNTNVTVTVTVAEHNHVLSVPREALHSEDGIEFVYRVVGGRLVRTPVKIGLANLTSVEIVSGLSGDESIVLGPAVSGKDLADGLAVRPVGGR